MFIWFKKWITHNMWLKILALILAIVTWLYINEEVTEAPSESLPRFLSAVRGEKAVVSKVVPIKADISGSPARGFKVQEKKIKIDPSSCEIWGRRSKLDKINEVFTQPIDVSREIANITRQINLREVRDVILPEDFLVIVEVPIVSRED